jgi:hypothetical protein
MNKMLEKLMEKKGKAKMDPEYKTAKMGVLKSLHGEMGKMMGEDVKGLKKVTVAAPDKESLKAGLEKAEDLVEGEPLEGEMDEADMDAEEAMPESLEEIEAKIAELEELKAKKLAMKVE